jgi:hypothetical protein
MGEERKTHEQRIYETAVKYAEQSQWYEDMSNQAEEAKRRAEAAKAERDKAEKALLEHVGRNIRERYIKVDEHRMVRVLFEQGASVVPIITKTNAAKPGVF